MTETELPSAAEKVADEAGKLQAFGGISIVQTRRDVKELLGRIGQYGFFDEYTKHDITHIDAMLGKLDWLVTPEAKQAMTSADWLMVVLSVYFHDLGMLITKDEYDKRQETQFSTFCDEVLFTDDGNGRDYVARVNEMPDDEREKFLYQEFVRYYHAARVRNWVEGRDVKDLGVAHAICREVQRILRPLDEVFREDLAKVCESHHLDDLFDTDKYPVKRYYGPSEQEVGNVQFAAIMLRTVDLLHITRDRTPSIAFRLLNPSDPVSQREWAKQAAVRAVTSKWGTDEDGNLTVSAPRDTIEVHARFTDGNGFFGLTSYLDYASVQLKKSFEWAHKSNQTLGVGHVFPWRAIDTDKVEAKGFLTEPFQFSLDQAKVLDLLTGHTLYNDSDVVLRELLQNSIDAVRLQHGDDSESTGKVVVKWNPADRILEVWDNGSGMTQEIIENNLLRAGSSRYQDPEFKKKHPQFNPISRFGIGVLSTFMVADQVEVLTCHPNDEQARQLSLRSVHGKYLVRTLDKGDIPESIRPHGTIVKLSIRPSAEIGNVASIARNWIVLPKCTVEVQEMGKESETIGFSSLKLALESSLRGAGTRMALDLESEKIQVVERQGEGFSLAYAVRWNEHFREWNFLQLPQRDGDEGSHLLVGSCVSGIRVENATPGFRTPTFWAMANSFGPSAPRTNVARSALDVTPEYRAFIRQVYAAYGDHIRDEVETMQSHRGYSLTWATAEAGILCHALSWGRPVALQDLRQVISTLPLYVIEEGGVRKSVSADSLDQYTSLYVVESAATEHMEHLLREIPGASRAALRKLLNESTADETDSTSPVICSKLGWHDWADDFLLSSWEVAVMKADSDARTCEFTLARVGEVPRWSRRSLAGTALERMQDDRDSFTGRPYTLARLPMQGVAAEGFKEHENQEIGAILGDTTYLLPNNPWQPMVDQLLKSDLAPADKHLRISLIGWLIAMASSHTYSGPRRTLSSLMDEAEARLSRLQASDWIDLAQFAEIAKDVRYEIFDTRKWRRWHNDFF
jgi:hypothetical protein